MERLVYEKIKIRQNKLEKAKEHDPWLFLRGEEVNSTDSTDLERIESILKEQPNIEHNPFATVPRQSIQKALQVIEEYSEELTIDS